MFSPPIINDYIHQLEVLKNDNKLHSIKTYLLIDKIDNYKLELVLFDSFDNTNSYLLNYIGEYYEQQSNSEAIDWYTKSAELGNSHAMYNLGYYYQYVEKDYDKAIDWYTKSNKLGNTCAMNSLGDYYVNIDIESSIYWYNKAINCGNKETFQILSDYYEDQINKDYITAIKWLMKCYELGNKFAIGKVAMTKFEESAYDIVYECLFKTNYKDMLLTKLPTKYVFNKMFSEINNLKSVKTQGIDKVLINSILKHF